MAKSLRDQIRENLLSSKLKKEIITIGDQEVEVRQILSIDNLEALNKSNDSKGVRDDFKYNSLLAMACTYVPGTNEKVFDFSDFETFKEISSVGGFQDKIVMTLYKLSDTVTEAKKN
jgi:hypothetical protein